MADHRTVELAGFSYQKSIIAKRRGAGGPWYLYSEESSEAVKGMIVVRAATWVCLWLIRRSVGQSNRGKKEVAGLYSRREPYDVPNQRKKQR